MSLTPRSNLIPSSSWNIRILSQSISNHRAITEVSVHVKEIFRGDVAACLDSGQTWRKVEELEQSTSQERSDGGKTWT